MKTTRRPGLGAHGWREVLGRFAQSGLTAPAFCEREGLGNKRFYYWRAKLAGEST